MENFINGLFNLWIGDENENIINGRKDKKK